MGWKDKLEQADKLMQQAKELASGELDGEKYETATNMVTEAQKLSEQGQKERKLQEIIETHEKQAGPQPTPPSPPPPPPPPGNGPALLTLNDVANRQGELSQEEAYRFFDGKTVRLIVTDVAAGKMHVKSYSKQTQTADPDAIKVLNEGTTTAGGFLVPPQYLQDLFAETRRQGNALRAYGWLNEHRTTSNQVLLPKGGGAATVGIVAENAAKPTADQTYSQVTINIYTWAGISKVSNQLLADGDPMVADLVARELGTLLGNLEEQKIINGSGTGEPRGILNTTGIGSVTYTDASPTGAELIPFIFDAISNVQQNFFAPPNGILMHPRHLALLQKSTNTGGDYIFNAPGAFHAPGGLANAVGATSVTQNSRIVMPTFVGIPIGTSSNIPVNLGGGTNESRIIVGDFNEAHWFQRQDVTLDASNQTSDAFEKNQTWFRLEERAGFSAERYPTAFCVISGTGLILT